RIGELRRGGPCALPARARGGRDEDEESENETCCLQPTHSAYSFDPVPTTREPPHHNTGARAFGTLEFSREEYGGKRLDANRHRTRCMHNHSAVNAQCNRHS